MDPQSRHVKAAAEVLRSGGLVIYPTDSVYGLGCDLFNKKAVARIYQIKGNDKRKLLSFICPDLKEIAEYAYVSNPAYKIMRHLLPGPVHLHSDRHETGPADPVGESKNRGHPGAGQSDLPGPAG